MSNISSNEEILNSAAVHYQKAQDESGYKINLKYSPEMLDQNFENILKSNQNRKRTILWFNPPYNNMISNNLGREFLNIIK